MKVSAWHITPTGQVRVCHIDDPSTYEGRNAAGDEGDSQTVTALRWQNYVCGMNRKDAIKLSIVVRKREGGG